MHLLFTPADLLIFTAAAEASTSGDAYWQWDAVVSLQASMHGDEDDYTSEIQFRPQDSPAAQKLKRDMLRIENQLAPDMQTDSFNRYDWIEAVRTAPDLATLSSCLGQLEAAIPPSCLSPQWSITPQLVKGAWLPVAKAAAPGADAAGSAAAGDAATLPAEGPEGGDVALPTSSAADEVSGATGKAQMMTGTWAAYFLTILHLRVGGSDQHVVNMRCLFATWMSALICTWSCVPAMFSYAFLTISMCCLSAATQLM